MRKYNSFGLTIESEIELLAPVTDADVDVRVVYGKCPSGMEFTVDYNWVKVSKTKAMVIIDDVANFYIHDGQEIIIEPCEGADEEQIRLYLMGTCMGAILQQRCRIPLHGSCVCKDGKAFIITGDSGTGKSTTAAEFVSRGWSLMSDDVTPVNLENGTYYAQSTYPGQKLWQDTIERSENGDRVVKNIIREEDGREKFQLHAGEAYVDAKLPLVYGVYLIPGSDKLLMDEVTGFAKTDVLMRNLYRGFMVVDKSGKSEQLKTCVKLGEQMRIFIVARPNGEYTEKKIVDWLIEQVEK